MPDSVVIPSLREVPMLPYAAGDLPRVDSDKLVLGALYICAPAILSLHLEQTSRHAYNSLVKALLPHVWDTAGTAFVHAMYSANEDALRLPVSPLWAVVVTWAIAQGDRRSAALVVARWHGL